MTPGSVVKPVAEPGMERQRRYATGTYVRSVGGDTSRFDKDLSVYQLLQIRFIYSEHVRKNGGLILNERLGNEISRFWFDL